MHLKLEARSPLFGAVFFLRVLEGWSSIGHKTFPRKTPSNIVGSAVNSGCVFFQFWQGWTSVSLILFSVEFAARSLAHDKSSQVMPGLIAILTHAIPWRAKARHSFPQKHKKKNVEVDALGQSKYCPRKPFQKYLVSLERLTSFLGAG